MANVTIHQLPALAIQATDQLEIQRTGGGASGKITVEQILDLVPDGTVAWGQIQGTLANQTDLQTALNTKANTDDLNAYLPLTGGTISGSLSVAGTLTVTGNSRIQVAFSGTAAAPVFSSTVAGNSGLFFADTFQSVGLSAGGVQRIKASATGVDVNGALNVSGNALIAQGSELGSGVLNIGHTANSASLASIQLVAEQGLGTQPYIQYSLAGSLNWAAGVHRDTGEFRIDPSNVPGINGIRVDLNGNLYVAGNIICAGDIQAFV
jgi:hypothetical protein